MSRAAAAIVVMCGANRRTPAFMSGRKAPKVETRHKEVRGSRPARSERVRSPGMKLTARTVAPGSSRATSARMWAKVRTNSVMPARSRAGSLARSSSRVTGSTVSPERRRFSIAIAIVAGGGGEQTDQGQAQRAATASGRSEQARC